MKMGTVLSPCPYDAAARRVFQSVNLRRPAILHYASWRCFPDIARWSVYPLIAAMPINLWIDVMGQLRTLATQQEVCTGGKNATHRGFAQCRFERISVSSRLARSTTLVRAPADSV